MAVMPRDVPLTRQQMYDWVQGWKKASNLGTMPPVDEYIRGKVQAHLDEFMPDQEINVPAPGDSAFTTVHATDYIMQDLESFLPGWSNG